MERRRRETVGGSSSSADDAAVKDYTLYVLMEGDRNSARALSLLHANTEIFARTFVQDVHALTSRPSFLTGVPILLDKLSGLAYRGTEAFRFLERSATEPVSATGMMGRKLKKTSRLAASSAMRTRGNFMNLNDAFGEVEESADLHHEVERASHKERTMADFERLRSSVDTSAKRIQSSASGSRGAFEM
jgi:hypothetical protein